MSEHTRKLLEECSSGCKMGIGSMEQIERFIKDEQLKKLIESYKKKHEEIEAESTKLLVPYGETGHEPGAVATAFSWFTTEMKLMVNTKDHEVAKLMMDGCNMGIQSISKFQNQYTEASKEAKDIAEKLVKLDEAFMNDLKEYL